MDISQSNRGSSSDPCNQKNSLKEKSKMTTSPIRQTTSSLPVNSTTKSKELGFPHHYKAIPKVNIQQLPSSTLFTSWANHVIRTYTSMDLIHEMNHLLTQAKSEFKSLEETQVYEKVSNFLIEHRRFFENKLQQQGTIPLQRPFSGKTQG